MFCLQCQSNWLVKTSGAGMILVINCTRISREGWKSGLRDYKSTIHELTDSHDHLYTEWLGVEKNYVNHKLWPPHPPHLNPNEQTLE